MTYRELLELYKNGRLDKEGKETVEADIEKHEAISDYLCDEMELPDLVLEETSSEESAQDFAKVVKRSIRRAFLKLGITVFIVTLIAVLFIQFGLPKIVEQRYYNPAEPIGDLVYGEETKMSRDLAVYSELMAPGYYRQDVDVNNRGYGNYDIYIRQTSGWDDGQFLNVAGKIEKGKLTYFGKEIFNQTLWDGIEWYNVSSMKEKKINKQTLLSSIKGKKQTAEDQTRAKQRLNELFSGQMYLCYVTLNQQSDYEKLHQFIFDRGYGSEFWCAVRTEEDTCANLWMMGDASVSTSMEWDKEKYPYLLTWQEPSGEKGDTLDKQYANINTNENMKTHFLSMTSYLQDQDKFCKMMGLSEESLSQAENYVAKNNLAITGFAAVMDKETALDFLNQTEVYTVKAVPLN